MCTFFFTTCTAISHTALTSFKTSATVNTRYFKKIQHVVQLHDLLMCFWTTTEVILCVFSSHHVHIDAHSSLDRTDMSPSLCHKCHYFDSYISAGSWHQIFPRDILGQEG